MPAPGDGPDELHFTTLGMFMIDQIHYGPPSDRKVADDIIGGAGTYGVLGARIFSPPPLSRTVGWIVDAGSDFPADCRAQLQALQTHLILRSTAERLTTRGWNSYGPSARDPDHRAFRYLAPKKRLEVADLVECGLARARCVHLICSPARAAGLRNELFASLGATSSKKSSRDGGGDGSGDGGGDGGGRRVPVVVWEPVPDLCVPAHREALFEALKLVDVVSPNHEELAGFFSDGPLPGGSSEWATIEHLASLLLRSGVGPTGDGVVVVRAGKRGCLMASRQRGMVRLPAYYEAGAGSGNHPKVVDPTGGGNAFVGGLGVGLVRNPGNIVLAAAMGSVAASFAIEQIGIPSCETAGCGQGEQWNGARVEERLQAYLKRLAELGTPL